MGTIASKSCAIEALTLTHCQGKSSPKIDLRKAKTMRTPLYWMEGPWPGRLALMPRPRGGDWLEDEIRSWRNSGVDLVVSTLTKEEITELDLSREADLCRSNGMEFILFSIPDRGLPPSAQSTAEVLRSMEKNWLKGKRWLSIAARVSGAHPCLLPVCWS